MDNPQRSSQLNHNPPQANALDNQCQQYRELQQLRQYYHEDEELDEFEEEFDQQQYGECPDEQQYQYQQFEEQRQQGQQEEQPFDQWNHQQIQGQQQLRQMSFEAERCVQGFPLLPFNPNPVHAHSQGNGPNDLVQNLEAHRYPPQHAALYVNPPQQNTINPTVRNQTFNQAVRRDALALNRLPNNQIGSSSSAFRPVQQTQYQTRNVPLVKHNSQLGIVGLGSTSHELSPAEYYVSGMRLPISSVRTSAPSDIGNRNLSLQKMHAQSMRSGAPNTTATNYQRRSDYGARWTPCSRPPSSVERKRPSKFLGNVENWLRVTVQKGLSKCHPIGYYVSANYSKNIEETRIPIAQTKIRRPVAQPFPIVPSNANPGNQTMANTCCDILTPQPLDFSLKRQNLANKQNSLAKRPSGEIRANEAAPHLSRNKRLRWRDESNEVASFSTPAQMTQRANQHQQFTPSGNGDVVYIGEVEQQQNRNNNGGVGNRNCNAGLNVPVIGPHQQPGPCNQAGRISMLQGPPKQRTDETRAVLPKSNEIFNSEEQCRGGPSKAVPHQMEISQSSQAPKGLTFQTIDGGYSDLHLKKLEGNYMNSRRLVFVNNKHILMTPIKFLRYLCTNMETGIHVEKFRFCLGPEIGVQHRTEIFAGRFCGVAHSEHNVLSVELAAANVLERMWNYFKIQGFDSSYAVFPGKRYFKVNLKLTNLCRIHNLGLVDQKVYDLKHVNYLTTPGPRFCCVCKVKNEQTVVRIDDKIWGGGKLAAAEMYKHLTDPIKGNLPPLVDVQLQDYFAVGAECPTLTQIFAERGLITNSPEGNKREWMLENNVTDADIDSCLHDPSNSSSYLDNNGIWVSANAKLEFKTRLEEAAKRASAGGLTYPESNHLV